MVNDDNNKAQIYVALSFTKGFHMYSPMWYSEPSFEEYRSMVIYLKEESDHPGSQRTFTKSGHRSSDSWHLTWPPVGKHPLPRSITGSCPAMSRAGDLRSVSGSDCPPTSLSSENSGFWEKLYLAVDILRDQGPWISWKRQEGSPLESSGGIGRTLPFGVPPFLLLLALPWRWEQKEKNEGLGLISLTPL